MKSLKILLQKDKFLQVWSGIFIITAILLLMTISSCCPKITPSELVNIKDSTVINYVQKDSVVIIEERKVVIDSLFVRVDSSGKAQMGPVKVKIKNGAFVKAEIKDSKLTVEGGCDSLEQKITWYEKETSYLREELSKKETVIEKKFIPKFYKFTFWFFILFCCFTATYIYLRVKNLVRPF